MPIYYISFADSTQFLGACHVKADCAKEAVINAHILGINPGGECKIVEVPTELIGRVEKYLNKLMNKEEALRIDNELMEGTGT